MSDLNDLFKQLAEAKAQDPKYQKNKKIEDTIKESVSSDLSGLFSQISAVKAEDPSVKKVKKLEKEIHESVKTDLSSLFAELSSLKKQKQELIDVNPQLAKEVVEETTEFTPELVEEIITEIAPLPTPVGVVPPETQIADLDKYLKPTTAAKEEHSLSKEFKTVNDKIKFLEQWIGKIQNAGPGSGEVNLRYLDDVDRSTIVDGNYLTYNAETKKFEFRVVSAVSSFNPTDIRNIYAEVKNADSVTIHKGDPVYLYRATGNKASVILANNTSDQFSAKTLGLAYTDIAPGNTGFILTKGVLVGVDTSMYSEGDTLYLGSTAGTLTNVKPHSPNHLVYIGVVERANQGQGQIYVSPQNGYELEELHNVNIDDLVELADGQFLKWSEADQQWVNSDLPSSVTWTNPDIAPANNFKTILGANDGYASITILEGVPGLGSSYVWKFDKTKITFPDSTTQTTAWTGTYSYTNLTDKPTLFSGSYTDLTNKPTLFSGSYTDLTNKPTIPSLTGYATESFVNTAISNVVGAAPDALNTLKEISDQLAADESGVAALTTTVASKVSLTGSYANPDWITSLAYSKLTGAPSIPTVPTNVSSFTNDAGYLTSADANSLTGTTLKSTVVSSSLTSVGTLTSLAVSGTGVTVGAKLKTFDDGNAHIHSTSQTLWLNAEDGSSVSINTQTGGNVNLGGTTSMNSGYGSVAPVYGVRAWISCGYVNGTMVTNGSGNLSVSRTAAGKYNFTFTDHNMPDGNYCVTATAKTPNDNSDVTANVGYNTSTTSTGFTIHTARYGDGFKDVPQLFVQVVR